MLRVFLVFSARVRRAGLAGLAAVALLSVMVPAAQAQQPAPLAQQAPPAPPGAATLQLSMTQAVTMALETNLGLKADRLDVGIAAENVAGARAAFRPLPCARRSR